MISNNHDDINVMINILLKYNLQKMILENANSLLNIKEIAYHTSCLCFTILEFVRALHTYVNCLIFTLQCFNINIYNEFRN